MQDPARHLERDVHRVAAVGDALTYVWRDHAALILVVGVHAALVPILLYATGLERFYRGPRFTVDILWWLTGLGVAATLFANRRLHARVTTERVGGALLVWTLHPVMFASFTSLKQALLHLVPYTWDPPFHRLDVMLHGGPAWQLAGPLLQPTVLRLLDHVYLAWFPVQVFFILGVMWAPSSRWRTRCLLTYALVWIVLGNVAAAFMGAGGPCYFTHFVTGGDSPYAPLFAHLWPLALNAQTGQRLVLDGAVSNQWSPFTGISAMPSLHVAVAVFLACVAANTRWWAVRAAGAAYALAIFLASVLLGWHYAVDGYLGGLGGWAIWWAVGRWVDRGAVRRPEPQV
jgi:hypothetical protein